jgi:hypothetical protein
MLSALVVVLIAAAPTPAPSEALRSSQHTYFEEERAGGFAWGGAGLASLGVGIPFLLNRDPGLRAFGIPAAAFGVLEVVLGISSFFSAPARVRRFDALLDASDAQQVVSLEQPRLHTVTRAFFVFQMVELGVLATGTALGAAGYARRDDTLLGLGLGLVFESLAFLVLDEVAKRRAETYQSVLDDWLPSNR